MGKRRGSGIKRFPFSETLALSTLADATVLSGNFDDTFSRETFIVSQHGTYTIRGGEVGEGPLHVGVAHSDYTDAEILEWFLADQAWNTGDMVAREQAKRKIRLIGTFRGFESNETLNNGNPIKTKILWKCEDGQTLEMFIVNDSGSALTTGTILESVGTVWARDI